MNKYYEFENKQFSCAIRNLRGWTEVMSLCRGYLQALNDTNIISDVERYETSLNMVKRVFEEQKRYS